MKKLIYVAGLSFFLLGCVTTDIYVFPVADTNELEMVCIVENEKVAVGDFISVVERRFAHHGIKTKLIENRKECVFTLDYTAERSWDIRPYLNYALITLRKDGVMIGNAEFHDAGGLTLSKYASTDVKMNPVIDQLLGSLDGSK